MCVTKYYEELPQYVKDIITELPYTFDYATEYETHYSLHTESGYIYEVVPK